MALSQCLDDSPARWPLKKNDVNLQEVYNERHRLALEELVSGGVDHFLGFLRRERLANFLSDDEMRRIAHAAVIPRCWSTHGDELTADQSVSSTADCSSVTYFPEVSDVEPPLLEIGWPAFTTGSFRGVTRAVAYFQPSYGECIYSCKEAARRMIKSAKEVIALVTDSLTDLDIFKDLQEASTQRKVPVYILLDQSSAPAFLKMCSQVNVRLEELQHMRVRTITGGTYFMRSGAKITGKVHERFMLIDGIKVATGSYRFNWTDGKLNSSNLIELSGQITESFDEEFRILYAQSVPINTHGPPSAHNSGIFGHLLIKHPAASSPQSARDRSVEAVCLASTPNRKPKTPDPEGQLLPDEPPTRETGQVGRSLSESSTIGEDVMDPGEEILAGCGVKWSPNSARAGTELVSVSTQTTCGPAVEAETQTDMEVLPDPNPDPHHTTEHVTPDTARNIPAAAAGDHAAASSSSSSSSSGSSSSRQRSTHHRPLGHHGPAALENNLRDCFHKLTKERQYHYSTIRTKLEHMVSVLAQRRELVDITNMTLGPGTHRGPRARRECGEGPQGPGLLVENVGVGTWPRARCLH